MVEFLNPGVSDHCPILLWAGNELYFGPKPLIQLQGWKWSISGLDDFNGTPMLRLYYKVKATKDVLKRVNVRM